MGNVRESRKANAPTLPIQNAFGLVMHTNVVLLRLIIRIFRIIVVNDIYDTRV